MKIALCDDDKIFLQTFSRLLKNTISKDKCDIICFNDPYELIKNNSGIELLFLDIDMPIIDGFKVAENLFGNNITIVYVTGNDALVYKAFNSTQSFGFIRKNCLDSDLSEVLKRFEKVNQFNKHYPINNNFAVVKLRYCDIIYIEKCGNNVIFYTQSEKYSERRSIGSLETLLSAEGFVRTHAGFIVNIDYILNIEKKDVKLTNGISIPLSRSRAKEVKIQFMRRSCLSGD